MPLTVNAPELRNLTSLNSSGASIAYQATAEIYPPECPLQHCRLNGVFLQNIAVQGHGENKAASCCAPSPRIICGARVTASPCSEAVRTSGAVDIAGLGSGHQVDHGVDNRR